MAAHIMPSDGLCTGAMLRDVYMLVCYIAPYCGVPSVITMWKLSCIMALFEKAVYS